ncbi:rho GTPase-activating protein REN1-like isoform X2 [Primulina eburnea]|uniref:rho GTPase-activating protein REN1-like isoform X2 n=1 Tax=Primulina eburnea TaxID=1245227 RepID=UPI003C6C8E2C
MTNVIADSSQGEGGNNEPSPPPAPPSPAFHGGNKVYKSGPLFLSSKGIGWTSWKKRWFILTQTSLVFFRSDPNVVPQKGSEVNLTLGGIDLNSSGSVVVKEDKKLLTVLFPDGRDGRAFTLKAETLEDLHEWKDALEEALKNAPSAALVTGPNGKLKNDQPNAADASSEQSKDRQVKSLVIGRPILLALEDIDGTPSFLEKALRFVEENAVKAEGILRQAADVDDVERRIREFEKGKCEFSSDEDPHVIADCVKYIIRELPSSPVPASCCKALLEACRTERGMRVNVVRSAICETFPEPNRRLLQRILMMMQKVASNKAVNRMSTSAVAACMAPLLLRPLLAGDCELENDFDVGGDGSVQLLQAAAAANHAQTIVITLLEEYDNIFGECSVTPEPYTDSEESGSESEEITDDDEDSFDDDGDDDATEDSRADSDEDFENELSETSSDTSENEYHKKISGGHSSGSESHQVVDVLKSSPKYAFSSSQNELFQHGCIEKIDDVQNHCHDDAKMQLNDSNEILGAYPSESSMFQDSSKPSHEPVRSVRRPAVWGRTPGKKNLSMESIDIPFEDEAEIRKLESMKSDLQNKISKEEMANLHLQDALEKWKRDLHERRLALEKDVARLQEQLKKELELRTALEAGLRISQQPHSVPSIANEKIKTELDEIARTEAEVFSLKQKAADLELHLIQQREQNSRIGYDVGNQLNQSPNDQSKFRKKKQIDIGALTISGAPDNFSRSKHEYNLEKPDGYKDRKLDSPFSTRKSLHLPQQTDSFRNPKATGALNLSSNTELGTNTPGTTSSRKSNPRGEGANSTTSALSKLTNRLNFLKERRSQIATELRNLDKGENSSQPIQNLGHSGGSENRQSHQNSKEQSLEKIQELENFESSHKSDDQNDRGTKLEVFPNLDRGKSESFPVDDKVQSRVPPRTYSR